MEAWLAGSDTRVHMSCIPAMLCKMFQLRARFSYRRVQGTRLHTPDSRSGDDDNRF